MKSKPERQPFRNRRMRQEPEPLLRHSRRRKQEPEPPLSHNHTMTLERQPLLIHNRSWSGREGKTHSRFPSPGLDWRLEPVGWSGFQAREPDCYRDETLTRTS